MPATLALILAEAPKDNDVDEEDDEIGKRRSARLRQNREKDRRRLRNWRLLPSEKREIGTGRRIAFREAAARARRWTKRGDKRTPGDSVDDSSSDSESE